MKKNLINTLVYLLILCAVLAGCKNGVSDVRPKVPKGTNGFIPDNINDYAFSELPTEHQKEIEKLYGCYWTDGIKNNCVEIGNEGLSIYSIIMGFSYKNIRWYRDSPSMWICFSYYKDDNEYSEDGRKVVLKFTKDDSGVTLRQYVIPMATESGPFTKGSQIQEIQKDGKTFYVYDKNDPASPKMKKPLVR